jgi:hypothetical protein
MYINGFRKQSTFFRLVFIVSCTRSEGKTIKDLSKKTKYRLRRINPKIEFESDRNATDQDVALLPCGRPN